MEKNFKSYYTVKQRYEPASLGLPCGSGGKEFTCNAGDLDSIPVLGRSPGEGKGYPLQYPDLESPWTV